MQGKRWTITKSYVSDPGQRTSGRTPTEKETLRFRLTDDDGEIYFKGVMVPTDTEALFEPLDSFGVEYGCTGIEIFEDGEWVYV